MTPIDFYFFWDVDFTLTEEYMQLPMFRANFDRIKEVLGRKGYEIERPGDYFKYPNSLLGEMGITYLTTFVRDAQPGGCFPGLTIKDLEDYGAQAEPAKGLSEGWHALAREFEGKANIHHHLISVGVVHMVEGFAKANNIYDLINSCGKKPCIAASAFTVNDDGVIKGPIDGVLGDTKPDRISRFLKIIALKEAGYNLEELDSEELDRINILLENGTPTENVFTFGDGETDNSMFSYGGRKGGPSTCVYKPGDWDDFREAIRTVDGAAKNIAPRDYSVNSPTYDLICQEIERKLRYGQFTVNPRVLYEYKRRKLINWVNRANTWFKTLTDPHIRAYMTNTIITPDNEIVRVNGRDKDYSRFLE